MTYSQIVVSGEISVSVIIVALATYSEITLNDLQNSAVTFGNSSIIPYAENVLVPPAAIIPNANNNFVIGTVVESTILVVVTETSSVKIGDLHSSTMSFYVIFQCQITTQDFYFSIVNFAYVQNSVLVLANFIQSNNSF